MPPVDSLLNETRLQACDVWVLGGGISGISTAIVLQSFGVQTAVITETTPRQLPGESHHPLVATGYAMASAYPHDLRVDGLEEISDASQAVLRNLSEQPFSGVRVYRLFEVFEHEPPPPPLASRRMSFRYFAGNAESLATLNPPIRPGASHVWGFCFDSYFADMPVYMPFLWSFYLDRGGMIVPMRYKAADVAAQVRHQSLINCLGLEAAVAADDPSPAVIMRGQQVIVPAAPLLTAPGGIPVAYNYTPSAEVFSRADGEPEYVHFFPRSDGWILGQTREPGVLDEHGNWVGAAVLGSTVTVEGIHIPKPILSLNDALLTSWQQHGFAQRPLKARTGYRYYRDPAGSGVRLETEILGETCLVHNYGHGGSGVTMSWGCALKVASLLFEFHPELKRPIASASSFDSTLLETLSYVQ